MNDKIHEALQRSIAAHVARDRAWMPQDRRGRWVVIEPGAGRYLTGCSAEVRAIADAATPRRARRFRSLSRARAFARETGGMLARWRRTPPGGGQWRRLSPWAWANLRIPRSPLLAPWMVSP